MFKKSILLLVILFVFSDVSAAHFPSLKELELQFEKLRPILDMQVQATANALANTEPTTEFAQTKFGKLISEQLEKLTQNSNGSVVVFDEETEHDEIKQDSDEKTEPLTEEKLDVTEMLIELIEKERRAKWDKELLQMYLDALEEEKRLSKHFAYNY